MIKFHTTQGSFTVELDHAKAPKTAANFLQYAKDGFYQGLIFHRVIPGFMVQGGGMEPGLKQKRGRPPIENEAANGLKNMTGTLAMARTSDPHSASSQFFINVADNDFLNHKSPSGPGWGYCVFGRVSEGMDTVKKIVGVKTGTRDGHENVPVQDVLIEKVEVIGE